MGFVHRVLRRQGVRVYHMCVCCVYAAWDGTVSLTAVMMTKRHCLLRTQCWHTCQAQAIQRRFALARLCKHLQLKVRNELDEGCALFLKVYVIPEPFFCLCIYVMFIYKHYLRGICMI